MVIYWKYGYFQITEWELICNLGEWCYQTVSTWETCFMTHSKPPVDVLAAAGKSLCHAMIQTALAILKLSKAISTSAIRWEYLENVHYHTIFKNKLQPRSLPSSGHILHAISHKPAMIRLFWTHAFTVQTKQARQAPVARCSGRIPATGWGVN